MREKGIEIELTDDARTLLGNLGYDPTYGARPLKRVIQRQLIDKLALKLLEGEFREGDSVEVDAADGELTFAQARGGRVERRRRLTGRRSGATGRVARAGPPQRRPAAPLISGRGSAPSWACWRSQRGCVDAGRFEAARVSRFG